MGEKRVRWLNITSAHTAPTLPHVCTPPAGGPAGQLPQEAEEEPGLVPLPPQHPPQKKGAVVVAWTDTNILQDPCLSWRQWSANSFVRRAKCQQDSN